MNDITPKEVSEILSHYTDLGYGIVIEGEDTSKIKQALSLASKTLANGTPIDKGDLIMFNLLMTTIADKGLPFEEVLLLIDNAKTSTEGDCISREAFRKHYCKINCGERQCVDHADRCLFIDELMQFKTEPERPQGEWSYGEDECGQDGWFCSECGFFVPWYYQYYEKDIDFIREYKACPHCLAEMVTYTGKDRDTKGGKE